MPSPLETRMWATINDPSADPHKKWKCAAIICYLVFGLRDENYRKAVEQVRIDLGIAGEDAAHSTPADPLATAGPSAGGGEVPCEESDEHSSKQAHDGSNESLGSDNELEGPQSQHVDVASTPHLSCSGEDDDRSTRVPDGYIESFDYDDDDAVPVQYARCDGFYMRLEPVAPPHSPIIQGFAFPTPIPMDPEQYRRYIDALPAPEPNVPPVESVKACFGLEAASSHDIDRLLDAHGHHALTAMKALGHRLPEWADEVDEELERYCDREKLIRRNGAFQGVVISGNDIPTNLLVCKYQREYGDGCRKADCHFSHNLAGLDLVRLVACS
ncbi:alpha-actinin [Ascosphaera pollenicola]|nr:alpha-actinin [Ascosphaera pollenicola]